MKKTWKGAPITALAYEGYRRRLAQITAKREGRAAISIAPIIPFILPSFSLYEQASARKICTKIQLSAERQQFEHA
jgi:hypothetical protein